MNTYIQECIVPNTQADTVVVSLRLKGAEAVRYERIIESAKGRNPYIDKSHVIRELLGLEEPKLITEAELRFFRTGKKQQSTEMEDINGSTVAPNSRESIPIKTEHPNHSKKAG